MTRSGTGAGLGTGTCCSTPSRCASIATSTVVASNAEPRFLISANGVEGVAWHRTATRTDNSPSRKTNLRKLSQAIVVVIIVEAAGGQEPQLARSARLAIDAESITRLKRGRRRYALQVYQRLCFLLRHAHGCGMSHKLRNSESSITG